jgi:hypothetical protein
MEHNPKIERLMVRVAALKQDAETIGKRHPAVEPVAFQARDVFLRVFQMMAANPQHDAGLDSAIEWLATVAAQTYKAADKAVGRARSDLTRLAANARLLGVSALER